jgi:hypothetical protein
MTTFLCLALLLPSPSTSIKAVEYSKENFKKFYQYDSSPGVMDNVKQSSLNFNLSKGEWYYFPESNTFEFHPDHVGQLIFSVASHSEFIYFEKPRRVLIFPFRSNGTNKPYVAESLMTRPNFVFKEEYQLFPALRTPNSGQEEQADGVRLPRRNEDKGNPAKLNATMNESEEIIKRVWGEFVTRDVKLGLYNQIPYFDFVKKGKIGLGYSNHGELLKTIKTDIKNILESTKQMPRDIEKQIEESKLIDNFEFTIIRRFIPYMFTNESYFLNYGSQPTNEKELMVLKYSPSALDLGIKAVQNENSYTESVRNKFKEISTLMVQMVKDLAYDFVFEEGTKFLTYFFMSKEPKSGSILKLVDFYKKMRFNGNSNVFLKEYHKAVLVPLGFNADNYNLAKDNTKFTDPNTIQKMERIKQLFIEIFTEMYDGLATLVPSLDESKGVKLLEARLPQYEERSPERHYLEVMIESCIQMKFNANEKEANIEAFSNVNFDEIIYNGLLYFYVGSVLSIYEKSFFWVLNDLPAMEKMKLKPEQGEMNNEATDWFVRNLMIFGLIDYRYDYALDDVMKYKELKFFKEKDVETLSPSVWGARRLLLV